MATTQLLPNSEIKTIKSIEKIEQIFVCPSVGNAGVTGAFNWKVAAATAVSVINTVAAYKIAKIKSDIAKNAWKVARDNWDYFLNTFRPCETKEVTEACTAQTTPKPDYDTAKAVYTQFTTEAFDKITPEFSRLNSLYCVCPDLAVWKDISLTKGRILGDTTNFAWRRAEARSESLSDMNWNRKINVLNRGRNLYGQAASYSKAATNLYDKLGDSYGKVAESAASFIGYALNREPSMYPQRRALQYPGYESIMQPQGETSGYDISSDFDIPGAYSNQGYSDVSYNG